jgi:hypothetical protein
MNDLAFISQALYSLKRRYGFPVDIMWRTASTVNRETGDKTVTKDSLRVGLMIVLPAAAKREFSYDLAYIAAAKNFTYGALYDTSQRQFIVDANDLPADFEITPGLWFVYKQGRYEVKDAQRFDDGTGWFVTGKQDVGVETGNVIQLHLFSEFSLTSEAEGEVA